MRAALDGGFAGTGASSSLLDLYARFALLLLEENRRVNLTAIREPEEVAAKHFLDSWRVQEFLDLRGKRVLDLGTGGGFPGVPLAAAVLEGEFVLVDSTRKKVDFLARALEELRLPNARAVWGRGEALLRRERFDGVLVRAGGRLAPLLRLLAPVRRSFRWLGCMKGPRVELELEEAARAGLLRAFPVEAAHSYDLPGNAGARRLVVFRGGAGG
ncbi:MAG TPA: 16S rRNA (guanine(527)-N(7))-methyltransferase RsmG [Planctomycetota bacterium]|jgi:16S rRNA (guanine527-N7)-methyltransferase|nr:16S rRNA (guanine(527)-N(7))-methyltransferase RsmG [Planctomycetota bacterium]